MNKQGLIQANELSESGTVNTVQISNLSNFYAVIFDNDIVEGAKQNRVSQTTVILPLIQKQMFQYIVLNGVDGAIATKGISVIRRIH